MKFERIFRSHSGLSGLLVLALAVFSGEAPAKSSSTCDPVYQQCVTADKCQDLADVSDARVACFRSCGVKESECRAEGLVPASTSAPPIDQSTEPAPDQQR
jgi:hypothetical protein